MAARSQEHDQPDAADDGEPVVKKRRRWWWRWLLFSLGLLVLGLIVLRMFLPSMVRWQVNRIINQNETYAGRIEQIDISLWRGAYTIHGLAFDKTTGNVPVPFITARTVDLAVDWDALFEGALVAQVVMHEPVIHFVDAPDASSSQAGANGPWLEMLTELVPLRINRFEVVDGTAYFHAYHKKPQVNIHVSQLQLMIDNLTNIQDDIMPLVTEVTAHGMVMDHAKAEFHMKLDPFSYYPTFELDMRLLSLDVTTLNDLTQAYGMFDYEHGWFDLVVELKSNEGQLEGHVQPLFRDVNIVDISGDLSAGNIVKLFWEALIGGVVQLFKNQPRDQFGTRIPVSGTLDQPQPAILDTLGNVLRNAFVRAYLPIISPDESQPTQGPPSRSEDILQFEPGSIIDSGAASQGL